MGENYKKVTSLLQKEPTVCLRVSFGRFNCLFCTDEPQLIIRNLSAMTFGKCFVER